MVSRINDVISRISEWGHGILHGFWRRMVFIIIMLITLVYLSIGMIKRSIIFQNGMGKDIVVENDWTSFEELYLTSDDNIKIHSWFISASQVGKGEDNEKEEDVNEKVNMKKNDVILFFHGNAGNLTQRTNFMKLFNKMGYDVLIIDYRGYGKSEGAPSEYGVAKDAMSAWDHLVNEKGYSPSNICVFGNSLGGAVGTGLVHELKKKNVKPKCLILQSTFSSIANFVPWILRILCRGDFDSVEKIKDVKCPVMVVHSKYDDMIPFFHSEIIMENLPTDIHSKHLTIKGSHNNPLLNEEYCKEFKNFLDECE